VGLLNATSGRAFVGGVEIGRDVFALQQRLGLCPQFDVLYPDLTVEEHLLFYVRLKGFPQAQERLHVAQLIDEVGLSAERRRLASALSGGQKRRLSIGIALAGNPAVVLLDEPSSGLDPGSRRAVWEVIKRAREHRCFLLTTHSMEEAEVLCTRIGIVVSGQLKCLGTSRHLKTRFGQGFKLDVICDPMEKQAADTFVRTVVPEATLAIASDSFLSYQAPKTIQLSKVFIKLESQKRLHGIINWGISQANLEEVFLAIVKHSEASDGAAGAAAVAGASAPPAEQHVALEV